MRSFLPDHLKFVHGVQADEKHAPIYEPGTGRNPQKREEALCRVNDGEKQSGRPLRKRNTVKTAQTGLNAPLTPLQQKLRARTKAIFESGRFRIWLAERSSRGPSVLGGVKPGRVVVLSGGLPSLGKRR